MNNYNINISCGIYEHHIKHAVNNVPWFWWAAWPFVISFLRRLLGKILPWRLSCFGLGVGGSAPLAMKKGCFIMEILWFKHHKCWFTACLFLINSVFSINHWIFQDCSTGFEHQTKACADGETLGFGWLGRKGIWTPIFRDRVSFP